MKRIIMFCLLILLLIPNVAMAHSRIESALPAQDAVVTTSPESIELTFNEAIEPLSNLKLANAAGENIDLEKAVVEGSVLKTTIPTPLINGIYTVKWTIVGADGHAVNGEYSFTVNAPEPIATEEPTAEPEPEETGKPSEEGDAAVNESDEITPEETPTPSGDEKLEGNPNNEDSFNYTPIIIIAVIIIAAVVVVSLRRRK